MNIGRDFGCCFFISSVDISIKSVSNCKLFKWLLIGAIGPKIENLTLEFALFEYNTEVTV